MYLTHETVTHLFMNLPHDRVTHIIFMNLTHETVTHVQFTNLTHERVTHVFMNLTHGHATVGRIRG